MSWSQWLQTLTEVDVKESSPAYLCSVEPSVGFMFGSTLTGPPSGPAPDSHTCCRSRTLRQSRFRSIIQNSPLLLCKAFRWLIRLWDAHWSTNTVVFYLLFTQKKLKLLKKSRMESVSAFRKRCFLSSRAFEVLWQKHFRGKETKLLSESCFYQPLFAGGRRESYVMLQVLLLKPHTCPDLQLFDWTEACKEKMVVARKHQHFWNFRSQTYQLLSILNHISDQSDV